MKDYEKLILLLEMQNVEVSPFIKLKKNELAIKGSFEIFDYEQYREVLTETKFNTASYENNPFFMTIGKVKSKKLGGMSIINHKNGEATSIKEVFDDESLTEQEKHEIVFKGIEKANNEYKRFMAYITINNQTVLKDYNKVLESKKQNKVNKLISKYIVFHFLLGLMMIIIDVLFLNNSYLNDKKAFVFTYNVLLNLLFIIPISKSIYIKYFSNRTSRNNLRINRFFSNCDSLLDINDKNFSRLEKDVYRYSSRVEKDKSIMYLQSTNKVLINLNKKALTIFKRNSSELFNKIVFYAIKAINLLPALGLVLLIVLSLV